MFNPIDPKPDFPKLEEEVLKFWEDNQIFEKSLEKTKNGKPFVFFEGPPTANGKPGIHHIEARAFKDLIPRFQTMLGKFVLRKGGWDTHGLPVELEVEKKLGISGKKQIESIKPTVRESIIEFNRLCKESVWQYKDDWEKLTKRMGFWIDLEDSYVTYHNSYIESVWRIIKQIWDKGLIYLGHKVVPYCPRCGTALSSHEVAQGYKEVTDTSVYVKFKLKSEPNTYILSWTTTPWTLPGNVALAVGKEIEYIKLKRRQDSVDVNFILARDLINKVFTRDLIDKEGNFAPAKAAVSNPGFEKTTHEEVGRFLGKELVGLEYEPLFDIPELKSDKSYKVYSADFVTTTDGTGVVHTAVMYGEEDYELGEKIGLPKFHTVDEAGHFISSVPDVGGMYVKSKKTDEKIFEHLKQNNCFLKTEVYKHEYPHCWRCNTPLLYYARDSWFIAMSKLREELKANNEQINWVPEYIKHGRFGEWLDGAKDWAISRERYWGTPLPIWQCEDNHPTVVGSIKELGLEKNTFYFARHGESEHNITLTASNYPELNPGHLTALGKKQVESLAKKIKEMGGVDLIFASDLLRVKDTADTIGKLLGIEVKTDERLREYNVGVYNGRPDAEYDKDFPVEVRWDKAAEGGETWKQLQERVVEFVKETNDKYEGKKILVVSHGDTLLMLQRYFGSEREYPKLGQAFQMNVSIVDLHRPYIDDVVLKCKECGKDAKRVPVVMDVWFDSGAMPYAQWHYPFENKEKIDTNEQFPADYISEAIDQTRGWFYTLLAVSTLLGKGSAYKNVISLGFLLDSKGQKMSKSKGNVIDPWMMINKYGVDSLRWYMYSVNQPGDDKLFSEKDAELVLRKNFVILWNVLGFFTTYANHADWKPSETKNKLDILDEWILIRLQEVINNVTESLEKFDAFRASRTVEEFINELSTWYVRRSRDRKGPAVYQTLYHVLKTLACLLAPFTPFIAESIWQTLKQEDDLESVHLAKWPEKKELTEVQKDILNSMSSGRSLVGLGLSQRKEKNIKVRQPLTIVWYNIQQKTIDDLKSIELHDSIEEIIAEELNVKKLEFNPSKSPVSIPPDTTGLFMSLDYDLNITPELKKEGLARELERLVQDMRKKTGLKVGEIVNLSYDTSDGELIAAFDLFDKKKTYINKISKAAGGEELEVEGKSVNISLGK